MRKVSIVVMFLFVLLLSVSCTNRANDDISNVGGIENEAETSQENVKSYNLAEGMDMPNVVVDTDKGKTFDLSTTEKPALINFWATWCPPCRSEMPGLQSLYEEYVDKMDFVLINVGETQEVIEDFLIENHNFTFPIGYDVDTKCATMFNITAIPTTFIVGKDKKIKNYIIGARPEAQFKEYIEKAINE